MYEIYSLNKVNYTKMLFFHKFLGCFLPDFRFLNLVEINREINNAGGSFRRIYVTMTNTCQLRKFNNHPTRKSPRKTFLSCFFLNLPTDIAGCCSAVKYTKHKQWAFLWTVYQRGIRVFQNCCNIINGLVSNIYTM